MAEVTKILFRIISTGRGVSKPTFGWDGIGACPDNAITDVASYNVPLSAQAVDGIHVPQRRWMGNVLTVRSVRKINHYNNRIERGDSEYKINRK
jgi:hypothetical protein